MCKTPQEQQAMVDMAMGSPRYTTGRYNGASNARRGGIDLTRAAMNLEIRNDTIGGIRFHLNPAMLTRLKNEPGFIPVIINIEPMKDLAGFLGVNNNA